MCVCVRHIARSIQHDYSRAACRSLALCRAPKQPVIPRYRMSSGTRCELAQLPRVRRQGGNRGSGRSEGSQCGGRATPAPSFPVVWQNFRPQVGNQPRLRAGTSLPARAGCLPPAPVPGAIAPGPGSGDDVSPPEPGGWVPGTMYRPRSRGVGGCREPGKVVGAWCCRLARQHLALMSMAVPFHNFTSPPAPLPSPPHPAGPGGRAGGRGEGHGRGTGAGEN